MSETNPLRIRQVQGDPSLLMIHRLLAEEPVKQKSPRAKLPENTAVVPMEPATARDPENNLPAVVEKPRSIESVVARAFGEPDVKVQRSRTSGVPGARVAKLVVWTTILVVAVVQPWIALKLILCVLLAFLATLLIFGSKSFWKAVLRVLARVSPIAPLSVQNIRLALDRFAMAWDAVLDQFPEALVEHLYMPDLGASDSGYIQLDRPAPGRLARLRQEAAV